MPRASAIRSKGGGSTEKEFYRRVIGGDPSGPLAEAYKISGGSRTMLRFITMPPKTPSELLMLVRRAFRDTFADREFRAESERVMQFQLLSFVGEEAERVNASVFRAATGPTRDIVKKMATQ